jgi:uncharacterized protein (TIGR03382 family)
VTSGVGSFYFHVTGPLQISAVATGDAIVVVSGITTKKPDAPFTLAASAVPAGSGSGSGAKDSSGSGCNAGGSAGLLVGLAAMLSARGRRRGGRPSAETPRRSA